MGLFTVVDWNSDGGPVAEFAAAAFSGRTKDAQALNKIFQKARLVALFSFVKHSKIDLKEIIEKNKFGFAENTMYKGVLNIAAILSTHTRKNILGWLIDAIRTKVYRKDFGASTGLIPGVTSEKWQQRASKLQLGGFSVWDSFGRENRLRMSRYWGALGMPLNPTTAKLSVPARPLFEPYLENTDVIGRLEQRMMDYFEDIGL